ncbi:MAG TPA: hypothetical protein VK619_17495 [Pyrinomonadaceae bacterium]|nr:hypothetical protein [Pyrinomonadaceae bacterium]
MSGKEAITNNRITTRDRFWSALLRYAPWLAFLLVSLPLPLYFLLRYFLAAEGAGVYMLFAMTSLALGSVVGLIVALLLFLYRKHWERVVRDRVAAQGVTASDLSWFMPELSRAERAALKQMEQQNLLLADAYRETLASRITASRVLTRTKKDLLLVDRRLNRANYIQSAEVNSLRDELKHDRERLEQIRREAEERRNESQARLQMIEAAASRDASQRETDFALRRLNESRGHLPLALEAVRLEQTAHEETEDELKRIEGERKLVD